VKDENPGLGKGVAGWLEERCQKEGLSLRQAAVRTGLSHATISDIIKGKSPSPVTLRKLAGASAQTVITTGWH